MARITGEIVIDRPVGEVFDFVADERNEPRYNPGLLRSDKVTDGPVGVGTRFTAAHAPARHPVDMIVEVTEYDRPRRFASHTTMSWAEVRGALTFDAAGAGTRMRWAWDVQPTGFAKVLAPVVGVIGRRQERAVWEGIRRYLEAGGEGDDAPARRVGLAVLAALVALSAYGGALGLLTGFLDLGPRVTSRLPLHSPVLGALALTAIVAIPTTAAAWLAAHGHGLAGMHRSPRESC